MSEPAQVFQFDDIQLEPHTFKIWKAGQPLALEPKAFAVLCFLLQHRARLVEKQELLDAVWKDTFVTPNVLTRVIAQLRKNLGDDPKEARYIETVPTRGYRFVAEVRLVPAVTGIAATGTLVTSMAAPENVTPPPFKRRPSPALMKWAAGCLVLLVLVFFLTRRETAQPVRVARTTQITNTPSVDLFPAFSPDGGVIAYSSLRNGAFELFARQLALGGREIQLTADGAQNLQPAWSPDGKLLAYCSRQRGGIWVIPALGGVARQLTTFGARPAWSPDGQQLVFQSEAPSDLNQAAFGAMPPSTLWLVSAQGGVPQPLTQPGTPPGGHSLPAWSPDGRRLVFVVSDIGLSELWTVTPQGREARRLLDGLGTFYDPVFAPDGQALFFSTASGNFRLWRMPLASATGLPSGAPEELANTGSSLARHLSVAPDGRRLAYSALTLRNNIGTVTLDPATARAQGEPQLLTQDTHYRKNNHLFSPDGSALAYNVWRMGADGEAWLMNADGSAPRQLTAEPAALLGWLPETPAAMLVAQLANGTRIHKLELETGRQTLVGEYPVRVRMGRLSPDGRQVVYNARTGGAVNVWSLTLADGATRQLTFDETFAGFASWSPDGQWLAYEIKRDDASHIAVLPRAGGTPTQLTFGPGQHWPGDWSPDNDKVVYAGQRDGIWNLWWVSRRDQRQQQLTHYTAANSYVRYPAWSPRGTQVVFEYGETTGNVWLAELK